MFSYTETDIVPKNIFVFGCGGTGSRTVPPLLQLIKSQSNWLLNPSIYLIDGDEVEPKNCSRQHFIPMDVGKNKAQVLSERYSAAYEIQALYYPAFFEQDSSLSREDEASVRRDDTQHSKERSGNKGVLRARICTSDLFKMTGFMCGKEVGEDGEDRDYLFNIVNEALSYEPAGPTGGRSVERVREEAFWRVKSICVDPCVVILCVDSAQARRNILAAMTYLHQNRKVFVIDAGNEDIFGQVMFYRLDHRMPLYDPSVARDIRQSLATGDLSVRLSNRIISLAGQVDAEGGVPLARALNGGTEETDEGFTSPLPITNITPSMRVLRLTSECDSEGAARLRELTTAFYITARGDMLPDASSTDMSIPILPCPDLFYDNLEDGEGTRSCADLDQTLSINTLMAAAIINIMNNLVYGLSFDFNAIRVSLNGGYSVDKMSPYWLKQVIQGRDKNYSSYLARQTWETMILPSKRTKGESELFLGNLVSNTYYHKNGKRNRYSEPSYITRVIGAVSEKFPEEESVREVMNVLRVLLSIPGPSESVITSASKLSEEQLNLLIDMFMYANLTAGILDLWYSDYAVWHPIPLHLTGVSMHGTLHGTREVISLSQTPTMVAGSGMGIPEMLTDYLLESFMKGEVSEDALLSFDRKRRIESSVDPIPAVPTANPDIAIGPSLVCTTHLESGTPLEVAMSSLTIMSGEG